MSLSKIVLKSTTKISLNDRFTGLRYENPSQNNGDFGKEHRQAVQASRKNQRLAAQMENRPAVLAALKKGKFQNIHRRLNIAQQTVPVKQRLAVSGRLSLPESKRSDTRTRGLQVRGQGRGMSRGVQNGNDRAFRGRDRFRGIGARIGHNFVPGRERGGSFRGGRGRGVAKSRGRGGTSRGFRIGN